jgi:hypothetical protein
MKYLSEYNDILLAMITFQGKPAYTNAYVACYDRPRGAINSRALSRMLIGHDTVVSQPVDNKYPIEIGPILRGAKVDHRPLWLFHVQGDVRVVHLEEGIELAEVVGPDILLVDIEETRNGVEEISFTDVTGERTQIDQQLTFRQTVQALTACKGHPLQTVELLFEYDAQRDLLLWGELSPSGEEKLGLCKNLKFIDYPFDPRQFPQIRFRSEQKLYSTIFELDRDLIR